MLSRWLVRRGRGGCKGEMCVGVRPTLYIYLYIYFLCDFLLRLFVLTTSNALQQRSTSCGTWPMPNVIKQVTSSWHTHTEHTHSTHTEHTHRAHIHSLCTHASLHAFIISHDRPERTYSAIFNMRFLTPLLWCLPLSPPSSPSSPFSLSASRSYTIIKCCVVHSMVEKDKGRCSFIWLTQMDVRVRVCVVGMLK